MTNRGVADVKQPEEKLHGQQARPLAHISNYFQKYLSQVDPKGQHYLNHSIGVTIRPVKHPQHLLRSKTFQNEENRKIDGAANKRRRQSGVAANTQDPHRVLHLLL